MLHRTDIQIRDPFVVPDQKNKRYFLFGTTDADPWRSDGIGFDAYTGDDLETWDGPFAAFRPPAGFWATTNFWAPEVHRYQGSWFMFASFKAPTACRATQILRADSVLGPYTLHSAEPVTPREWECLDGTLHVAADGTPWMVFCHEWVQVRDGQMCAVRLSGDLEHPVGLPRILFRASEAPWVRPIFRGEGEHRTENYVTDGPFLHRTGDGSLLILWSSISEHGYAMGVARSDNGQIDGSWTQEERPIADNDSGHGMVFRDLAGNLRIALHAPNKTPNERPLFMSVDEKGDRLVLREGPKGQASASPA